MIELQEIAALDFEDREIVELVMAEAVPLMTDRQRDCLRLYLGGMTQAEVGAELGICRRAVGYHIEAAFGKVKRVSVQYFPLPSISGITV